MKMLHCLVVLRFIIKHSLVFKKSFSILAFSVSVTYTVPSFSSGGIVKLDFGEINDFRIDHHCLEDRSLDLSFSAKKYVNMFGYYFYPNSFDSSNLQVFAAPVKKRFLDIYDNTSVSITYPIFSFRPTERFYHEIIGRSSLAQPCFRERQDIKVVQFSSQSIKLGC